MDYKNILSMKEYAQQQKEVLKEEIKIIKEILKQDVVLHIFSVGENNASEAYIKGKIKDAEEVGVKVELHKYKNNEIGSYALDSLVFNLSQYIINNNLPEGIIVQLPLPHNICFSNNIPRILDVDGFNSDSYVNPCTPQGIIDWLECNKINLDGKNAVVIGRSAIVGKPLARMLLERDANVTILHSHTNFTDLQDYVKKADFIFSAVGKENLLNKTDFKYKKSTCIIDIGINRNKEGKLCGDCEKNLPVGYQSPVPGGVGLLTRVSLYNNLVKLIRVRFRYIDDELDVRGY